MGKQPMSLTKETPVSEPGNHNVLTVAQAEMIAERIRQGFAERGHTEEGILKDFEAFRQQPSKRSPLHRTL
jgi:hypothetical protein